MVARGSRLGYKVKIRLRLRLVLKLGLRLRLGWCQNTGLSGNNLLLFLTYQADIYFTWVPTCPRWLPGRTETVSTKGFIKTEDLCMAKINATLDFQLDKPNFRYLPWIVIKVVLNECLNHFFQLLEELFNWTCHFNFLHWFNITLII